jgi:hypothetical protein
MNGQSKGTSPWVWVGIGCLGAVVLAVGAVLALGAFGYRKVKQLEAEIKDPQARTEKVRRILGTRHLPEGYHAVVGMSVPFVMDMAMLSDVEPDFREGRQPATLGRRGFIYLRTLSAGKDRQELRDYFEGRTDDADVLRRNNIRIGRRGEVLRRGALDMDADTKVMYLAQRGELDMAASRAQGITTIMLLDCAAQDSRQRFGIWFGPEPEALAGKGGAGESLTAADLAGTPADEAAIREFMGHFGLCRD